MVAIIRSVSAHPPSGMKSIDQYPFDLIGSSETPWVECRSLAPVPLSDQINHLDTRSPSQKRSVTDPDRRSLVLGAGVNVRKRFGVDQTVPPPVVFELIKVTAQLDARRGISFMLSFLKFIRRVPSNTPSKWPQDHGIILLCHEPRRFCI